jgi:hypothetical protein
MVDITSACSAVTLASRSAMSAKSRIERRRSDAACESNAVRKRLATAAMSPAMRPACAVSWPTSGRVAPGHRPPPAADASVSCWRTLGSSGGWSCEISVAAHSPNSDADAATTAGRGGSATSSYTRRSASTQLPEASRIASTRPTRTPRSTTGLPTPSPPTVRNRAV